MNYFEDLIQQHLSQYPLSKKIKKEELAMPPGPWQGAIRQDDTIKGQGYLGPLPTANDGSYATELGIGVNIGGQEKEIPSIVPGLTKEQLNHILSGGRPTDKIVDTAVKHARRRMKSNQSVWAD